ncbi:hypothetical protein [Treponema zioleckii]|uniref:hypothetical protein n=1 Tax=Treponema zioleckii TaxID=331680 RepID=UPI00168BF69B|nr:hypothetical protein [Treponema zioleckii]
MTLKLRNRWIKSFFFFSIFCIASVSICFVYSIIKNTILPPPDFKYPDFFKDFPALKTNFYATITSLLLFMLYVPAMTHFLFKYFENTHATEVIYYTMFLLGSLAEIMRLVTISFGLWQTFSDGLILFGRIVVFGRIIVTLSFLFASLLSDSDQRQNFGRNLMIMTALATFLATTLPLNTARISSTGFVTIGFGSLFNSTRFLMIVITFMSFWIKASTIESDKYKKVAISYLILIFGYLTITAADNFIYLVLGFSMLGIGSYFYLSNIHQHYWDY